MNPRTDHYTFLGVPMDAPADAIAVAWDRMQRQADALDATSPARAEAIRDKLRQVREDLLSGAQRRSEYDRWLMSARGPSSQEPTVVQPLGQPQPPPQYTTVMPQAQETVTSATPPAPSRNRLLLPAAILAALLLGIAIAVAATRVLGSGTNAAAPATATPKPTSAPTAAPTVVPTAVPTAEPTQPPPTATSAPAPSPTTAPAPTRPAPTVAPAADALTLDPQVIKSKGYTPGEGYAETNDGTGGTLYAWKAVCTGSADGYCQKVFFFDGTRYLGTDTLNSSTQIMSVDASGPATIGVTYANYLPNDPYCCPSGDPVTILYHWTGGRLVPSGTPPGHNP